MGVVFISYAHEDTDLAIRLTGRLEATHEIKVWRDRRSAGRGEVDDVIGRAVDDCECGVFLISRHWLNSPYSRWEAERLADRDRTLCIPVYLEPHDRLKRDIPPSLTGILGVDCSGDEYAALWELYCKIKDQSAGDEAEWNANGRKIVAGRDPVPLTQMPPEVRFSDAGVLECDRDHEFKLVQKHTATKHHLFLIAGPKCEGHGYFVSKVMGKLGTHELLRPTWRGGKRFPPSPGVYREALARELRCDRDADLPRKLRTLLEQKNVLLIHPAIECHYDEKAVLECYSEWLPALLEEAKAQNGVKCLQPIAWDVEKGLAAATRRWFRRDEIPENERLAGELITNIVGAKKLPATQIRLKPIGREHVDEFCELYVSDEDRPLLVKQLEAKNAQTSEEILAVIDEFMERRQIKRVG